jgi:hypothetical protein
MLMNTEETVQYYLGEIALRLHADPGMWTQRALARNRLGTKSSPLDPDSTEWCTAGLILRFVPDRLHGQARMLLTRLIGLRYGSMTIEQWNDNRAQLEDVIDLFECAARMPVSLATRSVYHPLEVRRTRARFDLWWEAESMMKFPTEFLSEKCFIPAEKDCAIA